MDLAHNSIFNPDMGCLLGTHVTFSMPTTSATSQSPEKFLTALHAHHKGQHNRDLDTCLDMTIMIKC